MALPPWPLLWGHAWVPGLVCACFLAQQLPVPACPGRMPGSFCLQVLARVHLAPLVPGQATCELPLRAGLAHRAILLDHIPCGDIWESVLGVVSPVCARTGAGPLVCRQPVHPSWVQKAHSAGIRGARVCVSGSVAAALRGLGTVVPQALPTQLPIIPGVGATNLLEKLPGYPGSECCCPWGA